MVHRKALWTALRRLGCPVKLVNVLKSLHDGNEARVIVGGELTESFPVTSDDLVLLAHTEAEVQRITDTFVQVYELIGMEVSTKKTKLLTVNAPENSTIKIHGAELEKVDEFCYLGGIVGSDSGLHAEISQRIRKAANAIYKLRKRVFDNRDLKKRTKIGVYRTVVIPTLLYGSESRTPYRVQVRALEKFHQRQLRKILNIKWSDYISNVRVLEMAECDSIERTLARNMLRWLGHLHRMPDQRIPKQLLYGELTSGSRSSGGQKIDIKISVMHCSRN